MATDDITRNTAPEISTNVAIPACGRTHGRTDDVFFGGRLFFFSFLAGWISACISRDEGFPASLFHVIVVTRCILSD